MMFPWTTSDEQITTCKEQVWAVNPIIDKEQQQDIFIDLVADTNRVSFRIHKRRDDDRKEGGVGWSSSSSDDEGRKSQNTWLCEDNEKYSKLW